MVNYCNSSTTINFNCPYKDNLSKAELMKRDETIQEVTTKYNKELKLRKETEQLKEQTEQQLVSKCYIHNDHS